MSDTQKPANGPQTGAQGFVPGWAPHMDAYAKNFPAPTPAPVPAPADVRDQIAAAIRDAACTGDCGTTEEECARQRIQPFAWHHGKLAIVEGSPEQFADAVLRVPAIAEALEAVAAVARVRHALMNQSYLTSLDETIAAALDPQEQSS
ncbi:hypothetical protein [Streptomyces wuyuanensis]|uniref:hypothetical protein n=1 Tax=Streptomyces wuyuanensis TaxID=1196353 RepID=UPI00343D0ECD